MFSSCYKGGMEKNDFNNLHFDCDHFKLSLNIVALKVEYSRRISQYSALAPWILRWAAAMAFPVPSQKYFHVSYKNI